MYYYSSRKLCVFLRGLLDGVAHHFKEKIDYEETECMHQGSDHCQFHLTFSEAQKTKAHIVFQGDSSLKKKECR